MIELTHAQKESIGYAYVAAEIQCASPYGRQKLARLAPFGPGGQAALAAELSNIERTLAARAGCERQYARLEHLFAQVKDIRGTLSRLEQGAVQPGAGVLGEVELFEVKRYLIQLSEIGPLFAEVNAEAGYEDIAFADTAEALKILDPDKSGVASFHISERWSVKLAEVRREKKQVEEAIRQLAKDGRQDENLLALRRRFVAEEQAEEEAVRAELSGKLGPHAPALLAGADAIAALDLTIQKAKQAVRREAVKPAIAGGAVALKGIWNPMVADALEAAGKAFTPVSLTLEAGATVITGANMGGKSVTLKSIALNVLLAHCGFYVFAEKLSTPLFDALWLLSDDLEDTGRGLSSFGGEIVRFGEINSRPEGEFSLILMDEFARGTNPEEGAAIAQSVAAHLNAKPNISVLTTHFDGVAAEARAHYQVVGLSGADIDALAKRLAAAPLPQRVGMIGREMNYGLFRVTGAAQMPRDALNICKLLGLESSIITKIEKKLLTFTHERLE